MVNINDDQEGGSCTTLLLGNTRIKHPQTATILNYLIENEDF